jgi:RimJ/RimL family protein N-acetyltransferase
VHSRQILAFTVDYVKYVQGDGLIELRRRRLTPLPSENSPIVKIDEPREISRPISGVQIPLPLETERLTIRAFVVGDADSLYRLHRDRLVTRFAGGPKSRTGSQEILMRIIERTSPAGFGPLAVVERTTTRLIGWSGIQKLESQQCNEVIFAFERQYWGQGFAFEAASTVMQSVFNLPSSEMDEISGFVFPQNLRSIAVLTKLGMTFVKHVRDEVTGRYACHYTVTRDQFLSKHRRY